MSVPTKSELIHGSFATTSRNAEAGRSSYLPRDVAAFYAENLPAGGSPARSSPQPPARSVQVKLTASAKSRMQQRWFAQTATGDGTAQERPRFTSSTRAERAAREDAAPDALASPSNPFSTLLDEWQLGASPSKRGSESAVRAHYESMQQAFRGSPAAVGAREAENSEAADGWSDEARRAGVVVLAQLRKRTIPCALLLEWGDVRKNDALTPKEFADAIGAHGSTLGPRETRMLFNSLDRSKVGRLSFDDLRILYTRDSGRLPGFDSGAGAAAPPACAPEPRRRLSAASAASRASSASAPGGGGGARGGAPSPYAQLSYRGDNGERVISWRNAEEMKREALARLAIEAQSEMRAALERCAAHAKHESDALVEEVRQGKAEWEHAFAMTTNVRRSPRARPSQRVSAARSRVAARAGGWRYVLTRSSLSRRSFVATAPARVTGGGPAHEGRARCGAALEPRVAPGGTRRVQFVRCGAREPGTQALLLPAHACTPHARHVHAACAPCTYARPRLRLVAPSVRDRPTLRVHPFRPPPVFTTQLREIEEQSALAKGQSSEHAATAKMLPQMRTRIGELLVELKTSERARAEQTQQLARASEMLAAAGFDPAIVEQTVASASASTPASAAALPRRTGGAGGAVRSEAAIFESLEAKTAALQRFVNDSATERDEIIASLQ